MEHVYIYMYIPLPHTVIFIENARNRHHIVKFILYRTDDAMYSGQVYAVPCKFVIYTFAWIRDIFSVGYTLVFVMNLYLHFISS